MIMRKKFNGVLGLVLVVLMGMYACSQTQQTTQEQPDQKNEVFVPEAYGTETYKEQWEKVENFKEQGRPRSALAKVRDIYEQSKANYNPSVQVKALLHIIKNEGQYKENSLIKHIDLLKQESKSAYYPIQQIMYSLLAQTYHTYYLKNQYKIMDRSDIAAQPSEALETWPARIFRDTIAKYYQKSLEPDSLLQTTKVDLISGLLQGDQQYREYRPMLYDILAHRALNFYTQRDFEVTVPKSAFHIKKTFYLGPSELFMNLDLKTPNPSSFKYRALRLYQNLLKAHNQHGRTSALIYNDLERLEYVHQNGSIPNADQRYYKALHKTVNRYQEADIAGDAYYRMAKLVNNGYEPTQYADSLPYKKVALQIIDKTQQEFPGSIGAHNCQELKKTIRQPMMASTYESTYLPNEPAKFLLEYKNLDTVYMRIYGMDQPEYIKYQRWSGEQLAKMLKKEDKPIRSEALPLKGPDDHLQHEQEIHLAPLDVGRYVILLGTEEDFSFNNSIGELGTFQVTGLRPVKIDSKIDSKQGLYVVDAKTGKPKNNVEVKLHRRTYNREKQVYERQEVIKKLQTDRNGRITIEEFDTKENYYPSFHQGDDQFYAAQGLSARKRTANQKIQKEAFLFTDRSIYRPGQDVHFKGILLRKQANNTKNELITAQEITTKLQDANRQKVKEQTFTTNEYGTFNGTFSLPSEILTGQMQLITPFGQTSISVEEYKRPNFEVNVKPVKGSFKVNENVNISGKAKSYTGAGLDQARVKYRVVRKARFPYWPWKWRPQPASPKKMVLNGLTETDGQGNFNFSFTAEPDPTIEPKTNPIFNYEVKVDVIDGTGETHSDQTTVKAGYKALKAGIKLDEWNPIDQPLEVKIDLRNLSGQKVNQPGQLKIQRLKAPDRMYRPLNWQIPDIRKLSQSAFHQKYPHDPYKKGKQQPLNWPVSTTLLEQEVASNEKLKFPGEDLGPYEAGYYKINYTTTDTFGQKVQRQKVFKAYHEATSETSLKEFSYLIPVKTKAKPGAKAKFIWGSAAEGYAQLQIERQGKVIEERHLQVNSGQSIIEVPIKESYRGNIQINLFTIHENRFFSYNHNVEVPWSNKKLNFKLETFRDVIKPGQQEEWQLKLRGPDAQAVQSELLASMYDASLGAYEPHDWNFSIYPDFSSQVNYRPVGCFNQVRGQSHYDQSRHASDYRSRQYESLFTRNAFYRPRYQKTLQMNVETSDQVEIKTDVQKDEGKAASKTKAQKAKEEQANEDQQPKPQIRKNLEETAFFFPELRTDEDGQISLNFTAPEALTKWKLMLLGHTKDLKKGYLEKEVVTRKELMAEPNAPRFLRIGDQIKFPVKVTNLTDEVKEAKVRLTLKNAYSMNTVSAQFGLKDSVKTIGIPANSSKTVKWEIQAPTGLEAFAYRVNASTKTHADGQQAIVPILPNKKLVTESLPLWVRGNESRKFNFDRIRKTSKSKTLEQHRVTLEMASNPSWYAVQALPTLMDHPYDNAEQIFNDFYASNISMHIINEYPQIEQIFKSWRKSDNLQSNLQQNQKLKSVALTETPWLQEAKNEAERKRQLARYFDPNNVQSSLNTAIEKLKRLQKPSGGFPWYEGMRANQFITQHIVAGFGHLEELGIKEYDNAASTLLKQAIQYLDGEMHQAYQSVQQRKDEFKAYDLSPLIIQYFYARSFFDRELDAKYQQAYDFWMAKMKKHWTDQSLMNQAMMALAFNRYGIKDIRDNIMISIDERALNDEEMGMYWKENEQSYHWFKAPIETQALLIEAYDEILQDEGSVEAMKVWLLKQKQVQDWETTKATAEACYALLRRGGKWLTNQEAAKVYLSGDQFKPREENIDVEEGTGYFKHAWEQEAVKPKKFDDIKVEKQGKGIAWGAVHWQYFEELDKITSYQTPLSLEKDVFKVITTDKGQQLKKLSNSKLKPGDLLRIKLVLETDRNMEFVHLKDLRAAALEPVEHSSGHQYQGGLGYYRSIRDASVNFFFDRLPKGSYVFEYSLRVTQSGTFQNGMANIQNMYAPGFNSHSDGVTLEID